MDSVGGVNGAGEVDDFGVSGVGGVTGPIWKSISASFSWRAGSVNKRNKTFGSKTSEASSKGNPDSTSNQESREVVRVTEEETE